MNCDAARCSYALIKSTKSPLPKRELLVAVVRYAKIRTDWQLVGSKERRDMSRRRTIAYDAFIDACNILSRKMREINRGPDTFSAPFT